MEETTIAVPSRTPRGARLLELAFLGVLGGCSAAGNADHGSEPTAQGGGSATVANGGRASGSGGGISIGIGGASVSSGGGSAAPDAWPSPACKGAPIAADTGEYCQAAPYDPSTAGTNLQNDSGCGSTLWGVARDFVGYAQSATNPPGTPHPDFGSHYCCGNPLGTVLPTLGVDGKPSYNPADVAGDYNTGGVGLSGKEAFAQWYTNVPGVNLAYLVGFHLVPSSDGVTRVFASKRYFPVDDVGFGNLNDYGEDGKSHNFGFTTELHTKFKYQGGEVFSFEGDDDLWVFIDKKLAIDLGGIHVAMQGSVMLDEFAKGAGLVIGEVYSLDLFNAERHPAGSNFKITTSMTFVDCGINPVVR